MHNNLNINVSGSAEHDDKESEFSDTSFSEDQMMMQLHQGDQNVCLQINHKT